MKNAWSEFSHGRLALTLTAGLALATTCISSALAARDITGELAKERSEEIAELAPVVLLGVRYEAPQWTRAEGLPHNGGYLRATDMRTGQQLWIIEIFPPLHDDGLEDDKRDAFITSIVPGSQGSCLLITDERGRRARLDLATRRIRQLSR